MIVLKPISKYGNLKASTIQIEKAAEEAGVNEFANSLPLKLKTVVGESGIKVIRWTASTYSNC